MEETNPMPSCRFSGLLQVTFLQFATWSEITCNGAFLPQNYIQYPRFCPLEITPSCLPAATMFN
jgi:hypothetical protein